MAISRRRFGMLTALASTAASVRTVDGQSARLAGRILGQLSSVADMIKPRVPGALSTTSITSWLLRGGGLIR
jgi:hypothetical protein